MRALPADVLTFWFPQPIAEPRGLLATTGRWSGGQATDDAVRARFLDEIEEAIAGGLTDWESSPDGRLALVVLLDQFPRHAFRGTKRQWEGDGRALRILEGLVSDGTADAVPPGRALLLGFPVLHSEDLAVHERLAPFLDRIYDRLPDYAAELRPGLRERAAFYRSLLARFGRYPFRNAVLGRESTSEERAFLEDFEPGPPRGFLPFMQRLGRELSSPGTSSSRRG